MTIITTKIPLISKDLESQKSVYRFYQKLLRLRKKHEECLWGETREYDHENRRIIAYSREYEGSRYFVVGNFSKKETGYEIPEEFKNSEVVLNNYDDVKKEGNKIFLHPYQSIVMKIITR